MAAAGFTPIQIYYSTTGAAVPTAANLLPGELGLNIADMKLYCENSSGVVTELASLGTPLQVRGNSTAGAEIRLPEDTDNGSNYVALKAADTLAGNVTFTLPNADGTNGQVLQTNGSGVLSFVSGASLATPLAVVGNATAGAEIRLPEDTDNGSNYVALKAPDTLASNLTFTLPSADGTNGQVLQTNGSGALSFIGAGDATANIGYLNIPQNSQSAAYTLVLADSGKHILHPSADTTARTFTIPANSSVAFPIGTAITFVNQNGAGVVTIAITTDTMRLAGAGTTGSRTLAANGVATCIKVTSTEWIISGVGLT